MNPFQHLERDKAYSPRSQSNWKMQQEFELELRNCTGLISMAEAKILKLKEDIQRITEAMAQGRSVHPARLVDTSRALDDEQRNVAALKDHSDRVQSEINSLVRPGPLQVSERLKQQIALGRLASERLKADHLIDRAVDELRRLLKERGEVSAKMRAAASAIDLQGKPDFLDEARFSALLSSLPSDIETASEQWAAWLAGAEQGKKRYISGRNITLPETLVNYNYYSAGDSMWLSKEQAAKLIEDHPVEEWMHPIIEPAAG